MRWLLALAVFLLLSGCAGQTGSVSDLLHPTPDGVLAVFEWLWRPGVKPAIGSRGVPADLSAATRARLDPSSRPRGGSPRLLRIELHPLRHS